MRFDPDKLHRRSIRLAGFDYARAGAYYVTICTEARLCLYGEVRSGEMILNKLGQVVVYAWEDLVKHYPYVDLDAFVIMPNHMHGILFLACTPSEPVRHPLSEIVRAFKSFSARRVNHWRKTPGQRVWQRNYFERVIRSDEELQNIRRYIAENPMNWDGDPEKPAAISPPLPCDQRSG